MADPIYGHDRRPGSLAQLSRFTRGGNDQMANFLLPLAKQDIFFKFYDFDEDTINSDWTVGNGGGASATSPTASTSLEYGQLTSTTGTANGATSTTGISYDGIFFDAARNPGMLVRLKLGAVSAAYLEVSWCDAPTSLTVLNWSDVDTATPTQASNDVTDIASVVFDTSQTNKSARLCTVGSTDTTTLGVNMSAATTTAGDPLGAGTFHTILLQCGATKTTPAANTSWVYANIDGKASNEAFAVHGTTFLNQGLDSGKKIRPHILLQARSATGVVLTIDYIALWCNRE